MSAGPGRFHGPLAGRLAVVAGLAGLAVAQPLLGLFGDNPEFFVSGGYDAGQVRWFSIVVAIVPVVVCCGAVAIASLLGRRPASIAYAAVAGALAALIGARFVLATGLDASAVVVVIAIVVAVAVVVADDRVPAFHLFLVYLAFGNILYLGLFSLGSRTSELLAQGDSGLPTGSIALVDEVSPVVMVVLDEFPLATVVREDGTINEERFPNLARLAGMSTWFRNTASRTAETPRAVPEILTGVESVEESLPTFAKHPRNFFTLLGPSRDVHSLEVATALCPDVYCGSAPAPPIRQAYEDASIVYAHKVLPSILTGGLPAIDKAYGGFVERSADEPSDEAVESDPVVDPYDLWRSRSLSERSGAAQRAAFREVMSTIDGSPSAHMIHVALPHAPWSLTPYGDLRNSVIPNEDSPGDADDEVRFRLKYQMHSMQAGATDVLVGELLDHLDQQGTLDDTLLVVTSDHGTSFSRPDTGRALTDDNAEDLLRVPLFIKEVGQTTGVVDDSPAQTIDVLPSVADSLGADVDWEFDGHSLFDGSSPKRERLIGDSVDPLMELARERASWVGEDGWRGLADVGPNGHLVGTAVEPDLLGALDARTARFAQAGLFESLPISGKNPYVVSGVVTAENRPRDLLVVVNGTIAGVLDGFSEVDDGWYFYGLVTDEYHEGANEVSVVAVDESGVLHPLRSEP